MANWRDVLGIFLLHARLERSHVPCNELMTRAHNIQANLLERKHSVVRDLELSPQLITELYATLRCVQKLPFRDFVLLQLSIKRALPNPQLICGLSSVTTCFPQRRNDRRTLDVRHPHPRRNRDNI
jgi:hypothetical protein